MQSILENNYLDSGYNLQLNTSNQFKKPIKLMYPYRAQKCCEHKEFLLVLQAHPSAAFLASRLTNQTRLPSAPVSVSHSIRIKLISSVFRHMRGIIHMNLKVLVQYYIHFCRLVNGTQSFYFCQHLSLLVIINDVCSLMKFVENLGKILTKKITVIILKMV